MTWVVEYEPLCVPSFLHPHNNGISLHNDLTVGMRSCIMYMGEAYQGILMKCATDEIILYKKRIFDTEGEAKGWAMRLHMENRNISKIYKSD